MSSENNSLQYILYKPRGQITMDIFEAERYEPAVIVQQLVGTLVYYSNFGKYEPRLASKWSTEDGVRWRFTIRNGFKCENGQSITPQSFKKSIERNLFAYQSSGGIPILSDLIGFADWIESNKRNNKLSSVSSLDGISTDGDELIFNFVRPIKSGLLEILSFISAGFICEGNFNEDGTWNNPSKFISSGPYKIHSIEIGKKYVLVRNENWPDFESSSPSKITFLHDEATIDQNLPYVTDLFTNDYKQSSDEIYNLVPEYINSILIGNLEKGPLSSRAKRQHFKTVFDQTLKEVLQPQFGINTRSNVFYPTHGELEFGTYQNTDSDLKLDHTFVVEGKLPEEGSTRWYAWIALKSTLEKLKLNFRFEGNETTFETATDRRFDFRIRGASIGAGSIEPWGASVLFCSPLGIRFPDPANRICGLVSLFERNEITNDQLERQFRHAVWEEAAILPVSHYGGRLVLSKHLDRSTISPLLSIMKIDKVKIWNR